ncbi:MAG: hypothetical protein LBE12_14535 [Planctomycetaceae bacterium]|jgi:hypothetical protein|nr:hypothetical protein [Planctomycetaceae bacterium]
MYLFTTTNKRQKLKGLATLNWINNGELVFGNIAVWVLISTYNRADTIFRKDVAVTAVVLFILLLTVH